MENNIYFKKIDELYEKYLQVWQDICNIESPSEYKKGIDDCCDYFVRLAKELGFSVEKLSQPLSGDPVLITMNPDALGKPISISGHIDTVHPVGSFGNPPTHIEGDKIYGPGVCDCKGGIVGAMMAMEALKECGYNARPIQLLIQVDEENNSIYSNKETIKWICEKAKNSVAFLNFEPNSNYDMCIERKGIITYKFKVKGVEAHASMCAERGSNAIVEAAHKIIELEKLKDNNGITCSCGLISGGTVANTVAGYCEFACDFRFTNEEEEKIIRDKVKEIENLVYIEGCTTEAELILHRCAMPLKESNLKLANVINSAFEKYSLKKLEIVKRGGGSDAADTTIFGLTTVDGLGVMGGNIHSSGEFAYIEDLKRCAKQAVAMVLEIN